MIRGDYKLLHITFPKQSDKLMEIESFMPDTDNSVILSGSFNPLHSGHRNLLLAAQKKSGLQNICYEFSIKNADKGQLSADDPQLLARIAQFLECPSGAGLVITNESLFINKAKLMPNCHFVIGYDTYVRILNPKYYGGKSENLCKVLGEFKRNNTKFVVAGRLVGEKW